MKIIASAIILSTISSLALADQIRAVSSETPRDTVRLVITGDPGFSVSQGVNALSTQNYRPDGFTTIDVNTSDAEAVIQYLKQQPGVKNVEKDLIVTHPTPVVLSQAFSSGSYLTKNSVLFDGDAPNDPEYLNQYSWFEPTEVYSGQHNIVRGVQLSVPNKKLRIGMADSGFYDREDIRYKGGYNFSSYLSDPGPVYFEDYHSPSCASPHGGAVAHIIGANTNNNIGVAGIVNADLYAARVMDCGIGYLNDMADGIRWLAKDTSLDSSIPQIDQAVDIINISMSANSSTCPSYVQNAIDMAHRKGIAVFVAAGNDSTAAVDYTPANCNNVLTIGSVNIQGEQSNFTNHGSAVDVSALGEHVRSEGTNNYSYWYGTSFSTPNAVGIAALAKQANPSMTVDTLYNYVRSTTRPYNPGATGNDLGTGIIDAKMLMEAVNSDSGANTPIFKPMLAIAGRCDKQAYSAAVYKDDQGSPVKACAIFEVDSRLQSAPLEFKNRSLYRVNQGASYDKASAELVKSSTKERFLAYNLDPKTYDYGFAFCNADNSICDDSPLIPLHDDMISPDTYCTP